MAYNPDKHTGRLKRLDPEFYRGQSWVHWTINIETRKQGWLTKLMHRAIRETLLHTLARYHLICPSYCLMPDHGHFLLGGLREKSDQLLAVRFFRKEWNRLLSLLDKPFKLQKQGHDHVLTEAERQRDAFPSVAHYIFANAKRAGIVENFEDYPFLGAIAAGYPDLDPRESEYWEKYWKIHALLCED